MLPKIVSLVWQAVKRQFNVVPDLDDEQNTILQIKKGVSFRGANLWVLVFAIFIASLGLNVNSTAVIIGAMLISPLMGPIIGIGLGIGIMDVELLRRAFRNYLVSTVISVITATVYFLLTPIADAQSELLARTSPSLYDVLIALFGGAAGILGLAMGGRGNVIPGVAIATALMPPLCTAGYGIAMGNASYFFGAFYLFFINTVFISLATTIGVRMMKFRRVVLDDAASLRKMQRYVGAIVIVTMLPAAYMTVGIVRDSLRQNNLSRFVKSEFRQEGTQILSSHINPDKGVIHVVAIGQKIDSLAIVSARRRLADYHLEDFQLRVIQGAGTDSLHIAGAMGAHALLRSTQMERDRLAARVEQLQDVQARLADYERWEALTPLVCREAAILFPAVAELSLAQTVIAHPDTSAVMPTVCAFVALKPKARLSAADKEKLQDWLQRRCQWGMVRLVVQ